MRLRSYPKYKPSGLDWIGEIPEQWEVKRLKFFSDIVLGKMLTTEDKGEYFLKPYLRAKNISWLTVDISDVQDMWFSARELLLYRLKKDDLLVSEGGEAGRTCIWNNELDECYIQNSVNRVRLNSDNNQRYFLYQFFVIAQKGHFEAIVNRVSIAHLTKEKLAEVAFIHPPFIEQQAIADFLDRETAEIDTLIAKKRELIERLQEKRTALISHIVTKGLDPTVPMKDSGVEWLGGIPAHWQLVKLKFATQPRGDAIKTGPFGSQLLSSEMMAGEVKVYNQRNVIDQDLSQGENYISKEKYAELRAFTVYPGDVLVTTRGTIGRCVIVPEDAELGILHPCLMRIQSNPQKMLSRFLVLLIQDSYLIQSQLFEMSNATTIEVIYSGTMREVKIPLPPISEQTTIVTYLDQEMTHLNTLIEKVERAIKQLQEYRTALISAAVTGKIDVQPHVRP